MAQKPKAIRSGLREQIDLALYLVKTHPRYRCSMIIALLALLIAAPAFNFSSTSGLLSLMVSLVGIFDAWRSTHSLWPSKGLEYETIRHNSILLPRPTKFSEFAPCPEDSELGYRLIDPGFESGQFALESNAVSDWLTTQPAIRVRIGRPQSYKFADKTDSIKLESQLKYLIAKIQGPTDTVNDAKFRISSELTPGVSEVELEKVGYYDALVTNEAFRSSIIIKPIGSEQQKIKIVDLRDFFQFEEIAYGKHTEVTLSSLQRNRCANSVGISTLAISSDNYPIFFEQSKRSDQGAGQIVLAGSGSVDFSDIKNAPARDLSKILTYSMAREFCEEAKQYTMRTCRKAITQEIASKTILTGYFRWIDRSGKPEFVGLTKLSKRLDQIRADNREVIDIRNSPFEIRIFTLSDIAALADKIRCLNYSLALSSAMAIWRLEQLAKNPDSEASDLVSKFIDPRRNRQHFLGG
jgi:hypothetical protein